MSLQTPRSRAWSKITAASSDRFAKRKLQLYRTLSITNCPVSECETMEDAKENICSDQGFSSQETEEMGQSNIYDEKAFAEALKDINSELESLRSLYNSKWFSDVRKSLEKNKSGKQVTNVETHTSTVTTGQLPRKTPSNNELNASQYRQSVSGVQSTTAIVPTALLPQRQSSLKREVNEPNRSHKIHPPHREKEFHDDREFQKKVEIPANISTRRPTDAPVGVVRRTSKEAVNMMNTIPEERKEENMDKTLHTDTQNQFSGTDKHLYNNFTQMLCEVDKITDELTELQRFKDALSAMNAEFENKETEASKIGGTIMVSQSRSLLSSSKVQAVLQRSSETRSPGLSFTSTNINIQQTNWKVNKLKMPHSATPYSSQVPKKFRNTQADKQKESNTELLNRREMQEKKKGTMNHSLQPTKQKSLTNSSSDNKKRNPQAVSENALPLEVNPLQVNNSASLVSRHYATNKMSNKSSPKTLKTVGLKRSVK